MVQELLPLLPREVGQAALYGTLFGTCIGAGLWLMGARYSRGLITLLTVALGGIIGMSLPRWMGWSISSSASAVAGAVGLGLSGYAMHRVWVGIGFGLLLACWAALGTWVICGDASTQWNWPMVYPATTLASFGGEVWTNLPERVRIVLPYACGAGMLSGFLTALLWPRVAVVLLYSSLGASLLLGMGVAAIEYGRPQWITIVPAQTWAQVMTLVGFVLFGAIVQWQLPARQAQATPKKE